MNIPREQAEVDHYGAQYSNFRADAVAAVRAATFGEDYGQNGWQTADEQDRFIEALALDSESRLLDVACGSGGPALRIVEKVACSVVGIDVHEQAVATATATASQRGLAEKAAFQRVDASRDLPFGPASFDAALCIDAINHLPDRPRVLAELARVLKPGGRLLYTDPIVVTGWLSDQEMRIRSSVGFFLFFPLRANEQMLEQAGFELLSVEDRTENMANMAGRWRAARAERASELRGIEGEAAFEGQQTFFEVAERLASERRLSRLAFSARKRG